MRCHRCHEETLEDATICHVCGAYLVGIPSPTAATGVTQRLIPPRFCLRCQGVMEAGTLVIDQRKRLVELSTIDWLPGDPDGMSFVRTPPLQAVIAYRCPDCGTIDLVVPPTSPT